jgi:uncharacterized protein
MFRLIFAALLLLPALAFADFDEAVQNYANGNYAPAMTEFRQLAEQGDATSTYFVGYFYYRGYGVPVDVAEAAKWFRKAAAQNNSQAQYYLGKMAQAGQGMERDPVAAYTWFSLSANSAPNNRDAAYTREEVKKLERKMTPEQIAKAKEMVASWKPEKK